MEDRMASVSGGVAGSARTVETELTAPTAGQISRQADDLVKASGDLAERLERVVNLILSNPNKNDTRAFPPQPEQFHHAMVHKLENVASNISDIHVQVLALERYFGGRD